MRVATNQCGEAAIARNANVCSISRVRSTEKCVLRQEARRVAARTMWRSVDRPECECMQHFGSAKHGEMRVATRSTTCCDNILEIKESIYGGK